MDIKELILARLRRRKTVTTSEIVKATGFSRAYVARNLKALCMEGQAQLLGKANLAHYVLPATGAMEKEVRGIKTIRRMMKNAGLEEHIVLEEIKRLNGVFRDLKPNVLGIFDYAFTEMLNNAIEHSRSKNIRTSVSRRERAIRFEIIDNGVGIFNNIMGKKGLTDPHDAANDLLKGKQTTAPTFHSGEGIFFTSKVADSLEISSFGLDLLFDNAIGDVFLRRAKPVNGTKVVFSISDSSDRRLKDVFNAYSDDSFEFNRTSVKVRLFKKDVDLLSRSQARRILVGLEKFKRVELDFAGVDTIGQGFTDEVFRVWGNMHPKIEVMPVNASKEVDFMVKRALSSK